MRRVAWERFDRDWRPRLDDEILEQWVVDANRPLTEPQASTPNDLEAVQLLLPVASDGPLDEGGLVIGPRRLNLTVGPTLPGHLSRSWAEQDGIAVQAVCLNYLRWSWAEARNPVLEFSRRRVVSSLEAAAVAQFCGDAWTKIEARYRSTAPDLWTALAEAAMAGGLADGPEFPDLNGWQHDVLVRHLAQRMAGTAPEVWSMHSVADITAEQLDLAVGEAWEDLFEEILRREGRLVLEDVDPGNTSTAWSEAVEAAVDKVRFTELLKLVLPRSRALALSRPDYQDLSLDEIGSILISEHVDLGLRGQQRWTTDDDIRVALLFWARPTALVNDTEWRDAMRRLLSDRQTARAVRYAALRYSASRGRRL